MRALFVASEIFPYIKTGGLGDVCGALPLALMSLDVDIRFLSPGYPQILDNLKNKKIICSFPTYFGMRDIRLIKGLLPNGITTYAIEGQNIWDRSDPYIDESGQDWDDNCERFGLLSHVAAHLHLYDEYWQPEIIHGNDWPGGLIPAYLSNHHQKPATIFTLHNMAFQGIFPASSMSKLLLPPHSFSTQGLEYHGQIGFLKAGIYYADRLTTVSPTYAREIQDSEYGFGLEGLIRQRRSCLSGILNGIDDNIWNPATDSYIYKKYDKQSLNKKQLNKNTLVQELGFLSLDSPLFAMVGRLTEQKGIHLLCGTVPRILASGVSLIVLGEGNKKISEKLVLLQRSYPGRFFFFPRYDEELAHRIQAGADALLVPSLFEPCGLVQMYALRYGTIPIVRHVGGLADTVCDGVTGFSFQNATPDALMKAIDTALGIYKNKNKWREMQYRAMSVNFGWRHSATIYKNLYSMACSSRMPMKANRYVGVIGGGKDKNQSVMTLEREWNK